MKALEEIKLKDAINLITEYEKRKDSKAIYSKINSLSLNSLQEFSFDADKELFDEISFVLSVIITIIHHPHIISYHRDEIIRADLAGHIENDSFQMVFKDPKLWRDKDNEMVPEEVYYHEHIDELKIYENIFIGMLINMIEQDLKKTLEFYVSLLPTLANASELVTSEEVKYAIEKSEKELKIIKYIKDTYFYRQIKTCNLNNKKIIPTNILLKDRLYNHCFKFYKKFIRYPDLLSLSMDFTKFYYYKLLSICSKKGAVYVEGNKKNDITLSYNDFNVHFLLNESEANIEATITKCDKEMKYKLYCAPDIATFDNSEMASFDNKIITIWNLYDSETIKPENDKALVEDELIEYWFNTLVNEVTLDKEIYARYCPVCKSHSVMESEGVITCLSCNSLYSFTTDKKAWIMRVRRK